jgi:hypothetical protein
MRAGEQALLAARTRLSSAEKSGTDVQVAAQSRA